MYANTLHNYFNKRFYLLFVVCVLASFIVNGQTVKGNIYAFKNLELNNIQVKAKKAGIITYSSNDGSFKIQCHPKDKLVFKGNGFESVTIGISSDCQNVKLIFKGGSKNKQKAIKSKHCSSSNLALAIENFAGYNCYPTPSGINNAFAANKFRRSDYTYLEHNKLNRSQNDYNYLLIEEKSNNKRW